MDHGFDPTRRKLLRRGLLGGALLTLGGAGFLAARPGQPATPPPEGLLVLSAREHGTLAAIARRLLPDTADAPSADALRVAFRADRILARAEGSVQGELKQLLGLFDNALAGLLFGRTRVAFSALDSKAQDAALAGWRDSRWALRRTGYLALRSLVMAAYYTSSASWAAVGYEGPPQGFHQPDAPVWTGEGPRPPGNGLLKEAP